MTSDDDETLGAYLEQRTVGGEVPLGAKRVRGLLDSASTWADPPDVLDGVLATIQAERDRAHAVAQNGAPVAARAVPAGRGQDPPPDAKVAASRLPRRRLFTLAAGIAIFAAGGAAGWVATGLPDGDQGTQIELAGTELAPGATAEGTVRETPNGVAITLQVSEEVEPAGPGEFYAAWVSAPDLDPVPIGTFHLRGGGDQAIELWSGVDTTRYQTITVTLESEQDGPESSGQVVLRGTIPTPSG
jgi:hypothetical protein